MAAMNDDYVTKKDFSEFKTEMTEFKVEMIDFKSEMIEFRGEFKEFKEEIRGLFTEFQRNIVNHMEENFATKQELKVEVTSSEERLSEKIHDTDTRLLRGYEYHPRATESHLKTLDGHTAANFLGQVSLAERMSVLEARMLNLELKRPPQ